MTAPPKRTLTIVFLTLFLDLVGFSIIFPMFPALAKHYLLVDFHNPILSAIFATVRALTGGASDPLASTSLVLFGGLLGAIYSFLQFLSAPFWGSLSDKIGRKPVLLISVSGLALSYLLWVFSGSFTVLVAARFLGGIMGGNMSTATAAVADITPPQQRAKGMAVVGIAFALGFMIGPAMGGILSLVNPLDSHPEWARYGINPFSAAAAFAFVLSLINLLCIACFFKETRNPLIESQPKRSANIFKLFKPLPIPEANRATLGYFLFLLIFSGMEFTLTFLAVERLGYSSMDNAYMFIYIGIVLSAIQGSVVRRKAHAIGEKRMVLAGLACLIPGLVILATMRSTWVLYAGLTCLAIGSAMVIPCLTALVSLYTSQNEQGRVIGTFRSLGALGRALGPLAASLVYWRFGSSIPYYLGSAALLIPISLIARLKQPTSSQ